MHDHIIVSGDDALVTTIIEELNFAGASTVRLATAETANTETALADAGIACASAIVCGGNDDAMNLEIALLARRANPDVRVVARLANEVLRGAVAADNGPGAILDVADLAAPAVVEACLAQSTHPFAAAGIEFVVWGTGAPHDGTLRELYGDLAPVAVIHGENCPTPNEVVDCPGRDHLAHAGDWIATIGTAEQVASHGIKVPLPTGPRHERPRLRRVLDAVRVVRDEVNPLIYPVSAAVGVLLIGSTVLLRFFYRAPPKMDWVDALYFSTETITTTGYGDFSFVHQPTGLRLFAAMMMFSGVTTTALLVAFIADLLLSRRFTQSAGRLRVHHLRNHVIVVGLSAIGIRVVTELSTAGHDVVIIERDESNRFLVSAAELDVPVIFGDATLSQTLESARIDRARAVAVLTRDDMINIETAIMLDEMLGLRLMPEINRSEVPIVLRVYDRALGFAVAERFGFDNVRSTVELAAPWFIGAAMGLQVMGTFSVGQRSFMVGEMHVEVGSELDGQRMFELSTQTRVIAITRQDAPVKLHPRRDERLCAGDTVYLVGPYRELLATLRQVQPSRRPAGNGGRPHQAQEVEKHEVEVSSEAKTM